ncbi:hypothetical protein BH09ACT4_BH09ACT4_21370 [soil metagenome]
MTEDQRVDPRYDPAFQRGFAGSVTSGVRSRTSVRRTALVSPAPYRAAAPEVEVEDYGVQDVEPTRSAATADPEPTPESVAVSSHRMRELTRNPFVVALVALGLVMSIGGIAWANQARQLVAARGGAATELDYWFLQASVVAAPLTILAGIGILAGVLFIAAGVWSRRPY